MIEYLINVALASVYPVGFFVVAGIICYYMFSKDKLAIKVTAIAILATLLYNGTRSSITYKHEPFDKIKEDKRIEHIIKQEENNTFVIKDMTKPLGVMSEEEFKNKVNYKEEK